MFTSLHRIFNPQVNEMREKLSEVEVAYSNAKAQIGAVQRERPKTAYATLKVR